MKFLIFKIRKVTDTGMDFDPEVGSSLSKNHPQSVAVNNERNYPPCLKIQLESF